MSGFLSSLVKVVVVAVVTEVAKEVVKQVNENQLALRTKPRIQFTVIRKSFGKDENDTTKGSDEERPLQGGYYEIVRAAANTKKTIAHMEVGKE